MNIGLTYDLREDYLAEGFSEDAVAEFDRSDTIDAIESTLRELGYTTDRIGHVKKLAQRLVKGDRWDLVFNIAEGVLGYAREAQVPALLQAYGIPCTFSDALVLALTLHKGMTKRVVRDAGVRTPGFAEVKCLADIADIRLPFPLFAKPIAEGTGKGITAASKIKDMAELTAACTRLLEQYQQPVLVEEFLPGREFTVGIVGEGRTAESVGVMEVILLDTAEKEVYTYLNKEKCEERVEYRKPVDALGKQAEEVALAAWQALDCRDAGRVDVRADKNGNVHFMEVNPLAGLHPEHSDLPILCTLYGIPFRELIRRIMAGAVKRVRSA
ncbi:MAG: D-alanine--D-alanine ligase [Fibrobacterota bacterium]